MLFSRTAHQAMNPRARTSRSGVATVELTIVLPVMLILVLGTIEVCQRIFLRQSGLIVAYEATRMAARSSSSSGEVIARCNELLAQRRVVGGEVTITPAELLEQAPGTLIEIRVSIPWASNSPTRFVMQDQGRVEVQSSMLRE
jgi:Flp pilus assembly protein TadG